MKKLICLFVAMTLFVPVLANLVEACPKQVKTLVKAQDLKNLELLIKKENNLNLNVINKHGKTPLDMAHEANNEAIITLLTQNGAKKASDLSDEENDLSTAWRAEYMVRKQKMIAAITPEAIVESSELPVLLQLMILIGINPVVLNFDSA